MAGYFFHLYNFILDVQKFKDRIESVTIQNTSNATKYFSNIKLKVHPKIPKELNEVTFRLLTDKELTQAERDNYNTLNKEVKEIYDIIPSWDDYYKFDYSNWEVMVRSAFDIYDDLIDAFQRQGINVPISINILGFNTEQKSIDCAMKKDIDDLVKRPETEKYVNDRFNITDNKYFNMCRRMDDILKYIKNQKHAYLLSKMIELKIARKDYQDNPALIAAYDAFIDVKKAISEKKYD